MFLRRAVLVLMVLALVPVPAAAETAPQVTDACGDAGTRGEWNGDSMDFEDSRPHLDIATGRVGGLYEGEALTGFTAAITVCGEVSAADGGYSIRWGYGDRCHGSLDWTLAGRNQPGDEGLSGAAHLASGSRGLFTEYCFRDQQTPLDPGTETIYAVELGEDALAFDGDTLTFTVAAAGLPEAALARLVPGTEWTGIGVVTMDQGPSLWAGYIDTEGNRGHLSVRADFALGGASYIVGEDA
jgi:hypothetical protein